MGDMAKSEAMDQLVKLVEDCAPEFTPWLEAALREKEEAERKQREQQEREVCTLRRARLPIAGQLPLPSQRQL